MIEFQIDATDFNKAHIWLATVTNQMDFVTSRALTAAVKKIHKDMRAMLPTVVDRPTRWTTRGLLVRYSTPSNLSAAVGFNYGLGDFFDYTGGVPAGRYMDVLASGGSRRHKSTEQKLIRAGIIPQNKFITPAGNGIGRLNAHGNVTPGNYELLITRMRAAFDAGYTSNAPKDGGSRGRSAAKKRQVDLLMPPRHRWRGDQKRRDVILQRTGRGPKGGTGKGSGQRGRPQTVGYRRGVKPAFWIVDAPQYKVQFPFREIAQRQFNAEIGGHFEESLRWAMMNPRG
jgi:hypothetical protein